MKILRCGSAFILVLVISIMATGFACAADVPINITDVKINGDSLNPYDVNRLNVDRGEELEVKVIFSAYADAENVQVEAEIRGYEYDDYESMSDLSHVFDIVANATYRKTLYLEIPERVEEDSYKLWVTVTDRFDEKVVAGYNLKIDAPRHELVIMDIILTPENQVVAGKTMLAAVRVKNMGDKDEDSVKVTISVPALGLSASDYIDDIESDDSETSEELYLRVPVCADQGEYDVIARLEYDDGYEEVSDATTMEVVEGDSCVVDIVDEGDEEQGSESDDAGQDSDEQEDAEDETAEEDSEDFRRDAVRGVLETALIILIVVLVLLGIAVGVMKLYQEDKENEYNY